MNLNRIKNSQSNEKCLYDEMVIVSRHGSPLKFQKPWETMEIMNTPIVRFRTYHSIFSPGCALQSSLY